MTSDKQNKQPPIPINIELNGKTYIGLARPLAESTDPTQATSFDIFLDQDIKGTLEFDGDRSFRFPECNDKELVNAIGSTIREWYIQKKTGQ